MEVGLEAAQHGLPSACNAGDLASIPRFRRASEEGNSYPLQYSGLVTSMDSVVHGVAKSWTQLSDLKYNVRGLCKLPDGREW